MDTRGSAAYGGFHIPGSINIGFEKQLANWVGMVIDPKFELLLVVDDRDAYDRIRYNPLSHDVRWWWENRGGI